MLKEFQCDVHAERDLRLSWRDRECCCRLPQASPEASSGASPSHHLPSPGGGPSLVVAGPNRRSKVSNAAVSSKLARGSQVGLVYPVHFTRTSLREPRPIFRVRARRISSTSYSSSPSSETMAGGWGSVTIWLGNGSVPAGRSKETWKTLSIPGGVLSR